MDMPIRLAWSRGFTPPRGYQSPIMDGDPGALVTPRRSGPEVVGSNPTGPTKRPTHTHTILNYSFLTTRPLFLTLFEFQFLQSKVLRVPWPVTCLSRFS